LPLGNTLTGAAKLDYDAATLLYENGDYAGALIKYQSAYEHAKDPRLLWNAAACEKNLHHYAKASTLVRQYLREGGDQLSDASKADAQSFLQAVAPFVASLSVTVNEVGANVYIDDEIAGVSPLAQPVLVTIGSRTLRVAKDGFVPHTQAIEVRGTDLALSVTLAPDVHEGRLHVQAEAGHSIVLDEHVVGVGEWEGKVASGGHTLRVTANHKRPYQSEILVQDNQTRAVEITLEDEPHGGIPTWVWITGGAVLVAAGASVGGYFLFKSSDTTSPPSVIGTISPGTFQADRVPHYSRP
jgi:hypothetical protein